MPNKNGSNRATRDQLLAKKPRTAKVAILLDDSLELAAEEAQLALARARSNGNTPDELASLETAVRKADERVEAATTWLRFEAVGSAAYDELVRKHPPTDEQIAEHQKLFPGDEPSYDADTFYPALIAASLVDPKLKVADVERLRDEWNVGEWNGLMLAAVDVNTMARR